MAVSQRGHHHFSNGQKADADFNARLHRRLQLVSARRRPEQVQQQPPLFDNLISEQKERFRDREPKCFRGLEIDSQIELGRLLNGQVGGPRALQNLVHIAGSASV
jgi:hypothetical protein